MGDAGQASEKAGDTPCNEMYTSFEDSVIFVALIVGVGAWLKPLVCGGRGGALSTQMLSVLNHYYALEKCRHIHGLCSTFRSEEQPSLC